MLLQRAKVLGIDFAVGVKRACLLIHHARKDRGSYRGTSKIAVTFESIIKLSEPESGRSYKGTAFDLDWEKYRRRMDEQTRALSVCLETPEGQPAVWKHVLSDKERLSELVALFKSCEYGTQEILAKALGVSTGTLSNMKWKTLGEGLIPKEQWASCLSAGRGRREEPPSYDDLDDPDDF